MFLQISLPYHKLHKLTGMLIAAVLGVLFGTVKRKTVTIN